jgi:hypothetical protein
LRAWRPPSQSCRTSRLTRYLCGFEHFGAATPAWAPLPALRELRIDAMGGSFSPRAAGAPQLQALLGRVAAAAPRLTLLHVSRGSEWVSNADLKAGRTFTPLPAVGAGMCGVASIAALQDLKLAYVAVTAAHVATADLPALRRLELHVCGAHAAAAAATLAAAAPKLEQLTVSCIPRTELDGAPGPGVAGLASLASASLRRLTLRTGFVAESYSDGTMARSGSVPDSGAALAAALLSLASRKALPALRCLDVSASASERLPPAFDAAQPWPALTALALRSVPPESVPAQLAALRAPKLASLSLPGIACGVALSSRPPAPCVAAAYEKLRADGHAPRLQALRTVDGCGGGGGGGSAGAGVKKEEEEDDDAGGAGGAGPSGTSG